MLLIKFGKSKVSRFALITSLILLSAVIFNECNNRIDKESDLLKMSAMNIIEIKEITIKLNSRLEVYFSNGEVWLYGDTQPEYNMVKLILSTGPRESIDIFGNNVARHPVGRSMPVRDIVKILSPRFVLDYGKYLKHNERNMIINKAIGITAFVSFMITLLCIYMSRMGRMSAVETSMQSAQAQSLPSGNKDKILAILLVTLCIVAVIVIKYK